MPDTPLHGGSSLDLFKISRCCAEAQADGVPCPTLGRDCEICARAMREAGFDSPPHPIRPVGSD